MIYADAEVNGGMVATVTGKNTVEPTSYWCEFAKRVRRAIVTLLTRSNVAHSLDYYAISGVRTVVCELVISSGKLASHVGAGGQLISASTRFASRSVCVCATPNITVTCRHVLHT